MFVNTLKNNVQTSIVTLLILSFCLWILSFLFKEVVLIGHSEQTHILLNSLFINQSSFWLKKIIIFCSITFGAIMVNFLAINEEITSKTNYLPAFLYLLFGFSTTVNSAIEPLLIANLCFIPALFFMMSSYRQETALSTFFKTGLCLGLSCFFYSYYILVLPVAYISLAIIRSFNWREWLMLLIGFFTSFHIYGCICYLKGEPLFKAFKIITESLANAQSPLVSEYYLFFLIVLAFVFVFAIFHYINKGFGNKIKTINNKYILLWLLLFLLMAIFYSQHTHMLFMPYAIVLSILLGDYLSEIKQLKVANTLLFLIIVGFSLVYCHALGFL